MLPAMDALMLHLPLPAPLRSMSPSAAHFSHPSANSSSLHQEIRSPSVLDSCEKISWNKPSALSQESLQYTCRFCHKVFLSFRALNGHMRIHGGSSDHGSREGNAAPHQYSLAPRFHRSFYLPGKYSRGPDIHTLPALEEEELEQELEEELDADAGGKLQEKPVNISGKQEASCINQVRSKRKPLYELRHNPKRSRVMTDMDFFWGLQDIQCPSATHEVSSPAPSSCASAHACSMCARTFCSLKALHGHMQSHPNRPLGQGGALMRLPYSTPLTDLVCAELRRHRCAYSFGGIDTKNQDKKAPLFNGRVSVHPQNSEPGTVQHAIGQPSSILSQIALTSVSLAFEGEPTSHSQGKLHTEAEPGSLETSAAVCLIMLSRGITDSQSSSVSDMSKGGCDEPIHHVVAGNCKEQSGSFGVARKDGKFQCKTCNRSFRSSQALGGHRTSHGTFKLKSSINKQIKAHANNVESDHSPHQLKGHACPLCQRIFLTGRALGGHMRCHWTGRHQNPDYGDAAAVNNEEPVSKREPNEAAGTDLNLPSCADDVDKHGSYSVSPSSSLEKPVDERECE